jgi:hypothetical protein
MKYLKKENKMKYLKKKKNYNFLIIQFVKTKNNDKFYLIKFVQKPNNLQKGGSFIIKTLPYIYNLGKFLGVANVSNYSLNYAFILRYLYCFGISKSYFKAL